MSNVLTNKLVFVLEGVELEVEGKKINIGKFELNIEAQTTDELVSKAQSILVDKVIPMFEKMAKSL